MMSLIKEFTTQADLKKSDGSDAGKNDIANKSRSGDVQFSLMRNTINSNGKVTGSDVANYLEKAHDINDEVDTVAYGLETSDGEIVKVYVNAAEAEAFEAEMQKLLGTEDDVEAAINDLATRFDIVDVVWPKGEGPSAEAPPEINDADALDMGDDSEPDNGGDEASADDMEVIATAQNRAASRVSQSKGRTQAPVYDDEETPPGASEGDVEGTDDGAAGGTPSDDEEDGEAEGEEEIEDEGREAEGSDDESEGEEVEEKPKNKKKGGKHDKLAAVGKAMAVGEELNGEGKMTLGSRFLQRVLVEAEGDHDGVMDGFNIPLDSQQRALAAKMRYKLPKQIIALFALIGIPGTRLNREGTVTGVMNAAEDLRTDISARRAFLAFYKAYAEAKGRVIQKDAEGEAITEARLKRGNFLQKQLETILVHLGLPEDLVATSGPGAVGSALYRASKDIEDNADLKHKMRTLALRLGIKPEEVSFPIDKRRDDEEAVTEAVDPTGADIFADAVMNLVAAMGVPDEAFARNARMVLAKNFRTMRIDYNVGGLLAMVKRFTQQFIAAKERAARAAGGTTMGPAGPAGGAK